MIEFAVTVTISWLTDMSQLLHLEQFMSTSHSGSNARLWICACRGTAKQLELTNHDAALGRHVLLLACSVALCGHAALATYRSWRVAIKTGESKIS